MLKIVNMKEYTGIEGTFAVWDTDSDTFLTNEYGDQAWGSKDDLINGMLDDDKTNRYLDEVLRLLSENIPVTTTAHHEAH